MASAQNPGATSKDGTMFKSKFGSIIILNLENYYQFSVSAKTALMAGGLWSIINGTEQRPSPPISDGDIENWDTKAGKAIGLLSSSVIPSISTSFSQFMEPVDPPSLWAYLKTYDRAKDIVYVTQLRDRFDTFKLDSDKIDVMEAYMKLKDLQTMLLETDKRVTDSNIKLKLVSGLPDSDFWHQIKVTVIKSGENLQEQSTL